MLAKNPDLTNEDVRRVLQITARDRGDPGWDPQFGFGIVDADSALKLLDTHVLFHRAGAGGSSQMTWGSHQHTFFNNGGLASGTYYGVEQWKITQQVDYANLQFENAPYAWVRKRGTLAWDGSNPNYELSCANLVPGSVTPTGCTAETFVYFIKYNLLGQTINEWWPCAPQDVAVNYSILGQAGLEAPLLEADLIQGADNHYFHVTWSDDNELHDGYELQCAICPEEEFCIRDYFTVANLPSGCHFYNYTPTVGSARYWFRVKAVWGEIVSNWGESSCLNVPNPPTDAGVSLKWVCGWPDGAKIAVPAEPGMEPACDEIRVRSALSQPLTDNALALVPGPGPGPEPPCFPTNVAYVSWNPPEYQAEPVDYYKVRLLLYLGGIPCVFWAGPYDAQACTLCLWPGHEYRLGVVAYKYSLHSDETVNTQVFTAGETVTCSDYSHKGSPPEIPESPEAGLTSGLWSSDHCLIQNSPNPFNPQTDISYNLPEDCMVNLVVYNMLGQKVRVLLDEQQTEGSKTVRWDGKDDNGDELASGLYFCRLQAGRHDETRKMILMR